MNENFWEQAPLVDQPANKPAKNFWDDAPIAADGTDAAPAPAPLPSAGFGTFGTSVGKSYNESNVQKGLADRVRIQGMLQELDAGGNPDINPVKTWGAGIKFDIGRALGANVDAPEVKRQYLLNRMGEIDEEIKSSGAAVQAAGPGSQQLSDLQAGLQEAQKKDSFLSKTGATFSALKESPGGIPELIGGGAYTMARPIAAGIGAAAVSQGSSLIPMAASALVSGADSYDGTMAEIIEQKGREGGIDVRKNPEAIPTLLQDANFIEAAKGEALRRGISDAAWSAISMRLGMSPKIKGVWQPVVQSAAEVGTEVTGQLARKGEVYDPTALPVAGVTGFAFEGPSYALGRAAGAFGKATPPPAAPGPQAQQAAAPTPVAPQPIDVDDLPSVAGETVEAPATPAPVAAVQPELPVQPAAQPQAVAPAPAPVAPAQPAVAQPVAPTGNERLPRDLAGAKPRFGYGNKNVELTFESDLDKAAYVTSQPSKNKRHDDYVAWAVKTFGMTEAELVAHGKKVRASAKETARTSSGNQATVGRVEFAQPKPAPVAPAQPVAQPAPAPVAAQPEPTPAPAPQPVATAQPEAKPVAPVAPAAQAEIPGTAETFNLTGEQVATPAPKAVDTTAEMPLPETRENPLATEARARLGKLEATGKGDSDQAQALRRTIERETQPAKPAAPAAQAEAPADSGQPNVDLTKDRDVEVETKVALAKADFALMAAFKKYGKKSQQYKDAQKAKKKIFEKALAEKSKALEAERDAQPTPTPVAEISPQQSPQAEAAPVAEAGYVVRIGKQEYKVGSLAEASKKWMDVQEEIDNQGMSWNRSQEFADIPNPTILDSSGKRIGWISQNGTIADGVPGKPKNKLFDPYAEPVAEPAPVEQPKKEAKPAKAEPTLKEAAKAQKTDQPQTKRARTALAKAIRENGADDKVTKNKYRALLRALEREGSRSASAKDVSQPYLGLSEPADIKAARELLAKKAKKEGKIENKDARKAEILIEQYEAEVDLAQGQLRDSDQIKLVSDKTLNRVVEHVRDMLDAGLNPDADAMNAMRLAGDEIARRSEIDAESFGDPIADVKGILRKYGVGIPLLPVIKTEKGDTVWADTEYSGLQENLPKELSQAGGIFVEPQVRGAGIDLDRARNDATYRSEVLVKSEGIMGDLAELMQELGWTQLEGGFDIIALLSDASDGKPQIPEGGVAGAQFKGDPSTVAKLHSGDVDLDMLGSEGQVKADEQADTREPEPAPEQVAESVAIEAEYNDPRFDAEPTPAEQAILDAASDNMPTEESILDALDKAAAERLDPKNRSSIGPDLIAAVMWQTARDIQKGVVTFAKWAADTVRNFPSLKGSLKAIWAKAQDIAKRPIDYIMFRAIDSNASKFWQNVRRNKGSATLRKIANIIFAKSGPDADATENDFWTRVDTVRSQFSNAYASIVERFAADLADMTPEQRRQWDADFRKYVIDGTTPSDPKLAKAVKDFRNLMRDLLAYQREAGIEMGDQGVNYFPRNYDPDAVEANRPGFVKAAIEMYRRMGERMYAKIMAEPITQEEIDTRAESLKDKDDKAGTTLRSDNEYNWIAEVQLEQTRQERADKYKFSADDLLQKAEDWATAITHGDVLGLTLFKASEGKITSDATDARKFSNDEAKLADEFLKKNVDDIMLGYIDGAVRGAELARVFGEDGKMFEQMMNKLSKEGVDAETVKETRRLVQKALGIGRDQSSQATAVFFDWVNVVLAGAFLGKTAIYNLILEPLSFGVRTGNGYLSLRSMAETWKYAIAEVFLNPSPVMRQRLEAKYGNRFKFEKAVTETVGEQLGLIQREMERAYLNNHWDYSSGEKGSKMAKWISQRIYRANLMSATEKAKVQASIGISRLALRDNARFLSGTAPIQKLFGALGFDTNADKSAAVIFRENGVPEADHKAFAAFVEGLEGKTDAEWQAAALDPKNKMAKHYRRALQRMSRGMSIKTNQALKMEMSDSVLGRLLMQLMNYSFAYANIVKDRMYSMAAQTVAKDASKIDRLRYAAPLMVGAPIAILGAAASKMLIAAMWPSDEMEEVNKKKSAARKAFDYASFAGMFGPKVEYLVKSFERGQTPGGPLAETIFRGGQAVFSAAGDPESQKKAYNARKQLYNSTVKPLVTGGAAAAHPFFGFLGNAAVNKQEVREAVIGEKPKK